MKKIILAMIAFMIVIVFISIPKDKENDHITAIIIGHEIKEIPCRKYANKHSYVFCIAEGDSVTSSRIPSKLVKDRKATGYRIKYQYEVNGKVYTKLSPWQWNKEWITLKELSVQIRKKPEQAYIVDPFVSGSIIKN